MAKIIALVGGGTMGPAAPLFALYRVLKRKYPDFSFVWAGTQNGPEQDPVESLSIPFESIPMAKLARYPSLRWFSFPFDYFRADRSAKLFLQKWQPSRVVGAGGFTQVPVMRAAAGMGIPYAIHQLDARPLLSNLIVARHAGCITSSFSLNANPFPGKSKVTVIPTPNRYAGVSLPVRGDARRRFGFRSQRPLILVVGGGTGSRVLNEVIERRLDMWQSHADVLHITGHGRTLGIAERSGYVRRSFLNAEEMLHAYVAADLVISRAGMGALSDVSALSKPVVLVPIPKSIQEENAQRVSTATVVVEEGNDFETRLYQAVVRLLQSSSDRSRRASGIHRLLPTDDGTAWAHELAGVIEK